ncbi:MAG: DUF4230 domain-containing protein [Chloroflexi bacterium]|nr:DUF4230 domain-containing protein [Chloroflexota bacterium]
MTEPEQPRGNTRRGELPPPPRITLNRLDDTDDDAPPLLARERDYPIAPTPNSCTVWLMLLVGVAAVAAIIMMNLATILPLIGQLRAQITPALPVATAPAGTAPSPEIITVMITPTPVVIDRGMILRRTQNLSRLVTVKNTYDDRIERAVTSSDATTQNVVNTVDEIIKGFGLDVQELTRDSITMVIYANVEAGVDLAKLTESDLIIDADGKGIRINLPPTEVFSIAVDNKLSYVEQRTTRFLARPKKELESETRQLAENLALKKACELGIMFVAADNAEENVRRLFEFAGFERIDVNAPAGDCIAPTK